MSPLGEVDAREISSSVPLIISMNVPGRDAAAAAAVAPPLRLLFAC